MEIGEPLQPQQQHQHGAVAAPSGLFSSGPPSKLLQKSCFQLPTVCVSASDLSEASAIFGRHNNNSSSSNGSSNGCCSLAATATLSPSSPSLYAAYASTTDSSTSSRWSTLHHHASHARSHSSQPSSAAALAVHSASTAATATDECIQLCRPQPRWQHLQYSTPVATTSSSELQVSLGGGGGADRPPSPGGGGLLKSGRAMSSLLHENWTGYSRHERNSSSSSDSGVAYQLSPPGAAAVVAAAAANMATMHHQSCYSFSGGLHSSPSAASVLSISPPGLSPLQIGADSAFSTPTPTSVTARRGTSTSHFTFDHPLPFSSISQSALLSPTAPHSHHHSRLTHPYHSSQRQYHSTATLSRSGSTIGGNSSRGSGILCGVNAAAPANLSPTDAVANRRSFFSFFAPPPCASTSASATNLCEMLLRRIQPSLSANALTTNGSNGECKNNNNNNNEENKADDDCDCKIISDERELEEDGTEDRPHVPMSQISSNPLKSLVFRSESMPAVRCPPPLSSISSVEKVLAYNMNLLQQTRQLSALRTPLTRTASSHVAPSAELCSTTPLSACSIGGALDQISASSAYPFSPPDIESPLTAMASAHADSGPSVFNFETMTLLPPPPSSLRHLQKELQKQQQQSAALPMVDALRSGSVTSTSSQPELFSGIGIAANMRRRSNNAGSGSSTTSLTFPLSTERSRETPPALDGTPPPPQLRAPPEIITTTTAAPSHTSAFTATSGKAALSRVFSTPSGTATSPSPAVGGRTKLVRRKTSKCVGRAAAVNGVATARQCFSPSKSMITTSTPLSSTSSTTLPMVTSSPLVVCSGSSNSSCKGGDNSGLSKGPIRKREKKSKKVESAGVAETECAEAGILAEGMRSAVPPSRRMDRRKTLRKVSSMEEEEEEEEGGEEMDDAESGDRFAAGTEMDDSDPNRQFACTFCDKDFRRPDILSRHLRRHTGEKPFRCEVCLRHFSRSDHLRTHKRTHTNEKPYTCQICPYAARRRDVLTRHVSTRHQMKASRTIFPRQRRASSKKRPADGATLASAAVSSFSADQLLANLAQFGRISGGSVGERKLPTKKQRRHNAAAGTSDCGIAPLTEAKRCAAADEDFVDVES